MYLTLYLETLISSFGILFFAAGVGWHFWNNRQHFWNPLVFEEAHPEEFSPGWRNKVFIPVSKDQSCKMSILLHAKKHTHKSVRKGIKRREIFGQAERIAPPIPHICQEHQGRCPWRKLVMWRNFHMTVCQVEKFSNLHMTDCHKEKFSTREM